MATHARSRTETDLVVEISEDDRAPKSSAWGGWITFASALFVVLGIFNVLNGITALARHQVLITGSHSQVVFNLTTWGWILIVFGALQLVTGYLLQRGAVWVRSMAVLLCMLNAIAQLAFLPHYPIWSTMVIAIDVLTIWAVTVHGGDDVIR
jgi:hypothetical protein